MADLSYQQARRIGLKEVKIRTARHEDPYVTVLEEVLPHLSSLHEVNLGTMRIDIEQIVGTRSAARQKAFSASFYPLLEENSEFAAKWSALAASHLKEGIRDPITAIEYLNRYYVVEGHKRVSVLRYFGAVSLPAEVKRIVPPRSDEPEIVAYYEFLDFYRLTKTNYLCFQRPGEYPALTELLCGENRETWNEDRQRSLMSDVTRFRKAFRASPLAGKLTQDEALLGYLQVFGYAHLQGRTPNELKADLAAIGPELLGSGNQTPPALMTDPNDQPRDLLTWITHLPTRTLKAAFLHDGDPESSLWTRSHELGRQYLQEIFGDRVQTQSYFNMNAENFQARAEALAEDGVQVIFSTSPKLQGPTLTAAGALPEIKFLNCSLNVSHPIMRCYYGRMYEANFLTGVVAGAMSPDGQIPYFIRYPVYSALASINAFALGAKTVNPRAIILLQSSEQPENELSSFRTYTGIAVISGKDSEGSDDLDRDTVVAMVRNGKRQDLISSFWGWGELYHRILESVLDGSWDSLNKTSEAGQGINYWWGLSGNAVEIKCEDALPDGIRRLVMLLRERIAVGSFRPFDGPVYDQDGVLRIAGDEILTHEQILNMDWLTDNVVGSVADLRHFKTGHPDDTGAENPPDGGTAE